MIYFDAAATSMQKPPGVSRATARAIERLASPGRGGHWPAQAAEKTMFECRLEAAKLFSCEPEQVVFTMNATHGLNIAIKSLVSTADRVVISGFEHNAVRRPLYGIGAEVVVAGRRLFDRDDLLSAFDREITRGTGAVVCNHVSNVFGFILPLEEIAALCRERGVPLIVDASQSAGSLPLSFRDLGAAFIAMPGHKGLFGPQGTGLLLCAQPGKPLLEGGTGSQSRPAQMPEELPERLEAGTPNVCGIAGLRAGLQFVRDTGEVEILAHETALRRRLQAKLQKYERIHCYCGPFDQQSGVLSMQIDGVDSEDAAQMLAQKGIAVRAGLHCAPMAHESAGTLQEGTLRVSFSPFNTAREVDCFACAVQEILRLTER